MKTEDLLPYLKRHYPRTSSFLCGFLLFIVDFFVLLLSILIGFFIVNLFAKNDINFKSFINYSVFMPFIILLYGSIGLYPGIMIPPTEEIKKLCYCTFFGFSAILISILITKNNDVELTNRIVKDSQNISIIFAFFISFLFSIILLPSFREIARRVFSHFSWWGVACVIYCKNNDSTLIIDRLINNRQLGYNPALIITTSDDKKFFENEYKNIPVFSEKNKEVLNTIKSYNIKTAIICDLTDNFSPIMMNYRYMIHVSKKGSAFTSTQQLKDIAGILAFASTHNLTFKQNLFFKRLIDLFLIFISLPLLIPLMLIISILVKLTSKGPVFYGHKRVGKNGKEIKCWKFRSMCTNSQEILEQILATDPKMKAEWEKDRKFINDPRVTKFGKFLRKTSLDELPQIFNILWGDMSFVGPRPVTEEELVKYGEYKDYVLSVLPGLTGMWQISGRSDTGYEERVSYDTYYIQNWSIWLDIWVLIKTFRIVIKGRGAY